MIKKVFFAILMLLQSTLAFSDEIPIRERLFIPYHLGISYPLAASISYGLLLSTDASEHPIPRQGTKYYPENLSYRLDVELGIGGATAGVGVFVPVGSTGNGGNGINIKAQIMRTWLLDVEDDDQYFGGATVEYAWLQDYAPFKVGVGYYVPVENGRADVLGSLFIGMGW